MNNEMQRAQRRERRKKLIKLKGGVCISCGSTEELEFDHKEPREMTFRISQKLRCSMTILLRELEKCQLLCRGCHISKTRKERASQTPPIKHGSSSTYTNRKCRCTDCRSAWAAYLLSRKQALKLISV
jgi:5-methylcytosine-specific restriction endonuclease McrA